MIIEGKAIGVMVVQDYKNALVYGEREQRILEFVSSQAAMAIFRKRSEENSPIPPYVAFGPGTPSRSGFFGRTVILIFWGATGHSCWIPACIRPQN